MQTKIISLLVLFLVASTSSLFGEDRAKTIGRLQAAGTILEEIMAAPDGGVPQEILGSADCVAVVPSLFKGGFVVGAAYGKGVATCRTAAGWSAPAFFRVEGGSFGLQIGGQAVDMIMLIMNERGMNRLLESKFKLGADASVAAGPVGRHVEGSTDWKLRAEVLTYSRARGAFAGLTVNGAGIRQDTGSTRAFYGRTVPYKSLLSGETPSPTDAWPFVGTVTKYTGTPKAAEKPAPPPPPPPAPTVPAQSQPKPAEPQPQPGTPEKTPDTRDPPKAD